MNNNKSTHNLMERGQPFQSPLARTGFKPNNTINYNVFSPTATRIQDNKVSQFNQFCDIWERNNSSNMDTSKLISNKTITPPLDFSKIVSPTSNNNPNFQPRPNFNPNKHSKNISTISPPP